MPQANPGRGELGSDTLGRFQILHNGQAIIFSAKVPRKILALLKAVIAYGPGPVAERDLIEALWPNVDGDAGYESLKVATRRLRKLLGEENAIHLKEGGISLNANLCWVDAFAFDESANRAIARELPSDTSACLKLYRGNFLPSEQDQSWSLVMRERLRRRFVHLVVERGKEFEKRADYETARQCYAHGLDADQVWVEELYQGLMRCHLAEAKHAEGIETYRRLRNILSVILECGSQPTKPALVSSLAADGTERSRSLLSTFISRSIDVRRLHFLVAPRFVPSLLLVSVLIGKRDLYARSGCLCCPYLSAYSTWT